MKVKAITIVIIIVILIIAVFTKPDDKTIIIQSVKAVWGSITPDEKAVPQYYEQFMDLNSKSVHINDWIVLKRIQYTFGNNTRTIGFAAFGKVMIRK